MYSKNQESKTRKTRGKIHKTSRKTDFFQKKKKEKTNKRKQNRFTF